MASVTGSYLATGYVAGIETGVSGGNAVAKPAVVFAELEVSGFCIANLVANRVSSSLSIAEANFSVSTSC